MTATSWVDRCDMFDIDVPVNHETFEVIQGLCRAVYLAHSALEVQMPYTVHLNRNHFFTVTPTACFFYALVLVLFTIDVFDSLPCSLFFLLIEV